MALLDAIIDVPGYRDRVADKGDVADAILNAQLVSATRLAERSLRVAPGAWNSASGTRYFSGNGKAKLWLADEMGQHYLQSVSADGIGIDTDGDGVADETFDLTTETWCIGLPRNAAAFSEPFDALELLEWSAATRKVWPVGRQNIAITSTAWGWSAPPNEVVEFVCELVHEVQQGHLASGALTLPTFDGNLPIDQRNQLWRRWKAIKDNYGLRRMRVVA